jgi:hypothetical protein
MQEQGAVGAVRIVHEMADRDQRLDLLLLAAKPIGPLEPGVRRAGLRGRAGSKEARVAPPGWRSP